VAQPQKRELAAAALEGAAMRVLELRAWLRREGGGPAGACALAASLAELKLTPQDTALVVPKAFVAHRAAEMADRAARLTHLAQLYTPQAPVLDVCEADEVLVDDDEAEEPAAAAQQESADEAAEAGDGPAPHALSDDLAAVRIQAAARGLLARRRVAAERAEEDAFLGMTPAFGDDAAAVVALHATAADIAQSRRALTLQYAQQFAASKAPTYDRLLLAEGPALRESIRAKLLAWVNAHRSPETGDYPDLPAEDSEVSAILDAPPPEPPAAKGAKARSAAVKPAAASKKGPVVFAPPRDTAAATALRAAAATYASAWTSPPADGAGDAWRRDLLEGALRPLLLAHTRAQVAAEVREVIATMRAANEAERAARPPTAQKGGAKGKPPPAAAKKAAPVVAAAAAPESSAKVKVPAAKDLTADVPLEQLAVELVAEGILRLDTTEGDSFSSIVAPRPVLAAPVPADAVAPPAAKAAPAKKGASQAAPAAFPVACVADVIDSLIEHAVLPLVLPSPPTLPRGVLLAGAAGSECGSLALSLATAAGAAVIDLTPTRTDGKLAYSGKAGGVMLAHKAFKVARALAPSVVLVNDAHLLFSTDKRTAAGLPCTEPLNRLRKDFMREAAALVPGDRVLVVLSTTDPAACLGKDPQGLGPMLSLALHVPLPGYGDRLALLQHLGAADPVAGQLAQLSSGRTGGHIVKCWQAAASGKPVATVAVQDVVPHLAALGPPDVDADAACADAVAEVTAAIASARQAGAAAKK
jgi:hypothetical protein